ncbi:MAG: hypothetical protein WCG19_05900 [Chlorobiaceae bacterium]
MANESLQQNPGVLSNLTGTLGKVALFPLEALKFGIVSAVNIITFAATTSINIANSVLKGVGSVLEGVQSVIAPKQ